MHCLEDNRRPKVREMLQMLRRLEGDLLCVSQWPSAHFQCDLTHRAGTENMISEDGHHLRDEAGSLLAAFELDGAEELTVASGGTAMAALICRQSHTLPDTMSSSRACLSFSHCPSRRSHLVNKVATRCRRRRFHFRFHARDLSLRLGPRKRQKALFSTISAHLPPPTQSEHIH
jgi:hypothetical protein